MQAIGENQTNVNEEKSRAMFAAFAQEFFRQGGYFHQQGNPFLSSNVSQTINAANAVPPPSMGPNILGGQQLTTAASQGVPSITHQPTGSKSSAPTTDPGLSQAMYNSFLLMFPQVNKEQVLKDKTKYY